MKAEQHRNQSSHASDKLESSFPFYEVDEQRSRERTPGCSHVQSKVEACGKRWKIQYYEHIPENFPAEDGDGAPTADSLNLSLVTCTSLGRGKRGTKTHFAISPLRQKVLDLSLTKSPLKAPSTLLPSHSRRGQFNISGDATVSSEFRIASPYVHLRKEIETPHGIEYITPSRKKPSRLRLGLFLGFSSCCKNNTIMSGNLKLKSGAKLHERKSLPASNECWEQERAWNVIANMDNHTIKKKVVLKKSLPADTHDAAKIVEALPSVAASDGSSAREVEPHVSLLTVCFPLETHASDSCNFRLSTSSADASLEVDAFAWDREQLSFTSENSTLTCLELLKPGRSEHMPRDEISARESSIVVSSCDQEPAITASAVSQRQIPSSTGMDLNTVVEEVPDAAGQGENPSTSQEAKKYEDDPLENLSLNVQRKLRESVAVVVISDDPYHDFKQSMLEMVIEKKLSKMGELEELLQYYLSLNPPCFQDVIVEVFTDLWLQLLHIS